MSKFTPRRGFNYGFPNSTPRTAPRPRLISQLLNPHQCVCWQPVFAMPETRQFVAQDAHPMACDRHERARKAALFSRPSRASLSTSSSRYYVGFIWMNSGLQVHCQGRPRQHCSSIWGTLGTWELPSQAARAGCAFCSRRLGLRRLSNERRLGQLSTVSNRRTAP